jgi:glucose/arabinose dehydrogenase
MAASSMNGRTLSRLPARSAACGVLLLAFLAGCGDSGGGSGPESLELRWEPVVEGLTVPNDLADIGDGRLLISDQAGYIYLWENGELRDQPLLDLTDRVIPPSQESQEAGLSGFAPHPGFADNGRLYLLYTERPPADADESVRRVDVLAEFTAAPGPGLLDPDTERVLLRLEHSRNSHVGGHMVFGDDGMLYVGIGNGDVPQLSQDPHQLPGSIIRIDVDGGDPYRIPPDNPFADGVDGAPEVFAYGFRNPYRVSWHSEIGLLIVEPMRQITKYQEVNAVVAGGNHGYPVVLESVRRDACLPPDQPGTVAQACLVGPDGQPFEPPVFEYGPDFGYRVSGVAQYDAVEIADLTGTVLVAEWRGGLLALSPDPDSRPWPATEIVALISGETPVGGYLWALDTDDAGNVYGLTANLDFSPGGGAVYRLAP